jgi:hypothetical protein
MEGRRVPLTPGATLHFDSLGFVYTRPVKSVAGRTFTRPPHPNILTGVAGRAVFVRGFSDKSIMSMLGQTRHRSVLGSLPTTSPNSPSRQVEPSRSLGEFMVRYTAMYPHG